ncbi:MAG: RidA family protein [Enterocloster asparagiformis]|nr:RidA family protein [Enterocloster asparagiformis]
METVETKFSVRDGGHYVPAVKYNEVLYISGQLSIDPETGRVPEGGVKAEARQALANLDLVLREAGATREDVLHCRVYIPDVAYWPDLNQVYGEFFGAHRPARVVVPTNKLYNGCLVEVEAVAACRKD